MLTFKYQLVHLIAAPQRTSRPVSPHEGLPRLLHQAHAVSGPGRNLACALCMVTVIFMGYIYIYLFLKKGGKNNHKTHVTLLH